MQNVKNDWEVITKARVENKESEIDDEVKFIDGAALMVLLLCLWLITAFLFSI